MSSEIEIKANTENWAKPEDLTSAAGRFKTYKFEVIERTMFWSAPDGLTYSVEVPNPTPRDKWIYATDSNGKRVIAFHDHSESGHCTLLRLSMRDTTNVGFTVFVEELRSDFAISLGARPEIADPTVDGNEVKIRLVGEDKETGLFDNHAKLHIATFRLQ